MRQRYVLPVGSIILSILLLAGALPAITGSSSGMPAIWTTNLQYDVNVNTYYSKEDVYLSGGPVGGEGLPAGAYCYQVTDTNGNPRSPIRRFEFATADEYPVQLSPFETSENGEYKVWACMAPDDGSIPSEMIPSECKTDNFKVLEVPKHFELWVTSRIDELAEGYWVEYALDQDGDPGAWIPGEMAYALDQSQLPDHMIYQYDASFEAGTMIYWKFGLGSPTDPQWESVTYGPEEILEEMVNQETLFLIYGSKFDREDPSTPIPEVFHLFRDGEEVQTTGEAVDSFSFVGYLGEGLTTEPGSYRVSCAGWAPDTEMFHEFTVDETSGGLDQRLDFESYQMLQLTSVKGDVVEEAFDVVFTPVKKADDAYKLSSSNTGSFFLKLVAYRDPDNPELGMKIVLPPYYGNTDPHRLPEPGPAEFDYPNFILQHNDTIEPDATSLTDVHIYEGCIEKKTADVTSAFEVSVEPDSDNKVIWIRGSMVDYESILVKVHLDFQIDSILAWQQVLDFQDFQYTFIFGFEGSFWGGGAVFGVG